MRTAPDTKAEATATAKTLLLDACVLALRAWIRAGMALEKIGVATDPRIALARQLTGRACDKGLLKYGRKKGE